MRYSLLNFIGCPVTGDELTCIVLEEVAAHQPHIALSACPRVSPSGALVGPLPERDREVPSRLREALTREAAPPASPERNREVTVKEGLLVAAATGRWYPIRGFIPELLPPHLRDARADHSWLRSLQDRLPPALFDCLGAPQIPSAAVLDAGLGYKLAEMGIRSKIDDPGFFGPGLVAPFNPHARSHSMHLIRLLGVCMPLLDPMATARTVLDTGSGYSWTTEWMWRLGLEAIGSDITRDYLELAIQRCGPQTPHLMVADTENLPILGDAVDAVLCFDAFHHVPDRRRAMQEFHRVLRPGGRVVLAEPNGEHEHAEGSQEVMRKYGILEKGMDWKDVCDYVAGSPFELPEEHVHLRVPRASLGLLPSSTVTFESLLNHALLPWNVFSIRKPGVDPAT